MITFSEFLEEAKKEKKNKDVLHSKKKIQKILDKQGGIGGKAVKKYADENPDRGVRRYTV